MNSQEFVWKVAGAAGEGIMSTGFSLAKLAPGMAGISSTTQNIHP